MTKSLIVAAALLFCLGSAQVAMADTLQTLPEFNGTVDVSDPGPYQPPTVVGTFDILPGDTSIAISGTFGNSEAGSSSGVNVYLGSILVGQCLEFASCYDTTTAWSDTLTLAQIASLGTGVVDFTATQTSQFVIRLGVTTLDQGTSATTPEPSSLLLLGSGVLSLLGLARKKANLTASA